MATLLVLLVFAYFVIKCDASVVEKLILAVLICLAALSPILWPDVRIWAAIAQGVLGVYVVFRMRYLSAMEKRGIRWK